MRSVFSTVAPVPLRPSRWSNRVSKGLTKKFSPPCDRISVGVANYIAPVLVEGATSLELLRQTWNASMLKQLKHGFEVLLIAA